MRAYLFISPDDLSALEQDTTGVGLNPAVASGSSPALAPERCAYRNPFQAMQTADDLHSTMCVIDVEGDMEVDCRQDKLPLQGKNWTILKSLDASPLLRLFAVELAEASLANFESKFTNDARPRAAIEASKAYAAQPSEANIRKLMEKRNDALAACRYATLQKASSAVRAASLAVSASELSSRWAAHSAAVLHPARSEQERKTSNTSSYALFSKLVDAAFAKV